MMTLFCQTVFFLPCFILCKFLLRSIFIYLTNFTYRGQQPLFWPCMLFLLQVLLWILNGLLSHTKHKPYEEEGSRMEVCLWTCDFLYPRVWHYLSERFFLPRPRVISLWWQHWRKSKGAANQGNARHLSIGNAVLFTDSTEKDKLIAWKKWAVKVK